MMKKIFNPLTFIICLLIIGSCVKPRNNDINYYNSNVNTTVNASNDLTINEFCARASTYLDSDCGLPGTSNHWVELYNPGDTVINFASTKYFLTDDSTVPNMYKLNGFNVNAKGYILVITDSPACADVTHMHANFHTSKSGGFVGLYKLVGTTYVPLTKHVYDAQSSGYSEGRYPDNGTTWYDFTLPTPLAPNSTAGGFTLSLTQ